MTEQPPEYMVLKKEGAARTDTTELRHAIERVASRLFVACYSASAVGDDQSAIIDVDALRDACDLLRCLDLLLSGQDVMGAFGSPSDWAAFSDIGIALRRLYSDGAGNQILRVP